MDVELRLLRPFLRVAELSSITQAALQLGISQPRLSLLIRTLEKQLGVQLFVRAHRGIQLTESGKSYYEQALEVEKALNALRNTAKQIAGERRRTLRIGTPRYQADVPERNALMLDLSLRHPSLGIEYRHGRSPELRDALVNTELDAAFLTEPFEKRGLEIIHIATGRAMLAIPIDHPLASQNVVTMDSLKGVRVATMPHYVGLQYIKSWFGPLETAGATLIQGEEDHVGAMISFAERTRATTVVHVWSDQDLATIIGRNKMVLRPINTNLVDLRIMLARCAHSNSTPLDWLWQTANTSVATRDSW